MKELTSIMRIITLAIPGKKYINLIIKIDTAVENITLVIFSKKLFLFLGFNILRLIYKVQEIMPKILIKLRNISVLLYNIDKK